MGKTSVDLPTFRRDMKALGYAVTVRTGGEFATATVKRDGEKINGGNVLTPEHLEAHRGFYDYRNGTSVMNGGMRVIF